MNGHLLIIVNITLYWFQE